MLVGFARACCSPACRSPCPTRRSRGSCRASTASGDLLAGVALGWKQLLTITLPVGDYQALLVPAFVLVLTSTIVALSVALRAQVGRARRCCRRSRLFVVGIAFGPETVPWPVPCGARHCSPSCCSGWSGGAGDGAASRSGVARRRSDRRGRPSTPRVDSGFGVRTLVAGGVLLAVAAAASIGAAHGAAADRGARRAAHRDRAAVRPARLPEPARRVPPLPARRPRATTPCSRSPGCPTARASASPRSTATTASSTRSAATRSTARRAPSCASRPVSTSPAIAGTPVELDVTIADYDGRLAADRRAVRVGRLRRRPRRTPARRVLLQRHSGTAAVIGGLASGDSYRLDAVLPVAADRRPSSASVDARDRPTCRGSASCPTSSPSHLDGYVERHHRSRSPPRRRALRGSRRRATSATASARTSRRAAPVTRPTASPSSSPPRA